MKHVEDKSVTNILLVNKENCALRLVDEIILYYDARSKKHQIIRKYVILKMETAKLITQHGRHIL